MIIIAAVVCEHQKVRKKNDERTQLSGGKNKLNWHHLSPPQKISFGIEKVPMKS